VAKNVQWTESSKNVTWRDQLHESLIPKPWSEFGIDLIIGSKADNLVGAEKQMFLPQYLFDYFDAAEVIDSAKKELVAKEVSILKFEKTEKMRNQTPWFTPHILFLILLLTEGVFWWKYRNIDQPKWVKIYHSILFLIAGIGSLIILFLWFFTNHQATRPNWNIIWVSPLFLVYPFLKLGVTKLAMRSFLILGIGIALINTLFPFLPQVFNDYNFGAYALLLLILLNEGRRIQA
jgi:hypothetical protein